MTAAHVLMLTGEFPPRLTGGLGVVAGEHARRLAADPGVRVTVWTRGAARLRVEPAERLLVCRFPWRDSDGCRPGHLRRLWRVWGARGWPAPDVLYVHSPGAAPLVRRLRRRAAAPVVYYCHSLIVTESRRRGRQRRWQEGLLRRAARVLVPTPDAAAALLRHYPGCKGRVAVVPHGIDLGTEAAVPAARRPDRLLYVGRWSHVKGLDVLLRALARVRRHRPGVRLDVIGVGTRPRRRVIGRLIRRLRLRRRVRLLGWVPHRRLGAHYRRASVAVVPSRDESFGLAALEALAHGTPLVCTNVGGLRQIPPDAAWKVSPGSAHRLAEAILAALADPEEAAARARRGREWTERFGWDAAASQLRGIFAEVVAGR